ncbi:related to 54S ribosomal protein L17, mitochondrial [Nakaseomyces glabratus]|nr:related to 54S ribosomal protein L17, mitochondrial [Nakaseomyces glabratus]SLM10263.1 related to 54S ribosomal protein L17, mitochondrial [Nakaseomyces glabratus]
MLSVRGLATAAKATGSPAVKVGLILSRVPLVSPEKSELESSYYKYMSELERRLMWTFPAYFYFKKGTLSEHRFYAAQKGPISKQEGVWFPKGVPDIKHGRERSQKQTINLPKSKQQEGQASDDISRPIIANSIVTEADKNNDLTSLERSLRRTLYLLIKDKKGIWKFPNFDIGEENSLHGAAEKGIREIGAAVLKDDPKSSQFLIKSHILMGRFDIQDKRILSDFAWLSKDEIKGKVEKNYYEKISFLLSDI